MRVLVAGASGVVGAALVPMLREAGHQVWGITRCPGKAESLDQLGARLLVLDATDAGAVDEAVAACRPEAVINQLTDLPDLFDPATLPGAYAKTAQVRRTGTAHLAAAAARHGTRRLISQSLAFMYAPDGGVVKDETAPILTQAPDPFDQVVDGTVALEHRTTQTPGLEGVVLRYGWLYGPGTWWASDGSIAGQVRAGSYPIIGAGCGIWSWLHVDDAASAAVAALDAGHGVYNITDDDPVMLHTWLPDYARILGAPPPPRLSEQDALPAAGDLQVAMATSLRGASNTKAKTELGWAPRHRSWNRGFRDALG